jgi:hypothetical protein
MDSEVSFSLCTLGYDTHDHPTFDAAFRDFILHGPIENWPHVMIYKISGEKQTYIRLTSLLCRDIVDIIREEMERRKCRLEYCIDWQKEGF